jgi:membrane-associated phospholipid phosphatase
VLDTQRPRTAGRPLLYAAARRPAAALIIACVIITGVLGGLVSGESRADRLDAWADGHINAWLGGHPRLADIIYLGDPFWVVAICAVAVTALLLARRWRGALLVTIAVPLAGLLAEHILKPLFDRTSQGALEYPSGHTTAVTTMAVAAVIVLTGPGRPRLPAGLRWAVSAGLLALIPWVAIGLVIVHFHYFSDTIGGAGTGITVALGTALGIDAAAAWVGRRLRPEAPARADPAATVPDRRNEWSSGPPAPPS